MTSKITQHPRSSAMGRVSLVPRFSLLPVSLCLSLYRSVGTGRRQPWERGWERVWETRNRNSEFFRKPTTLRRIKIDRTVNLHPPLNHGLMKPRDSQNAPFSHPWFGGGGGGGSSINFPSILSKILWKESTSRNSGHSQWESRSSKNDTIVRMAYCRTLRGSHPLCENS